MSTPETADTEKMNLKPLAPDGGGSGGVTDGSVLKNCKEMRYLWLDTPKLTDFSFQKDCAKVKQFTFYGLAQPDFALIPEAEYVRLHWDNITGMRRESRFRERGRAYKEENIS